MIDPDRPGLVRALEILTHRIAAHRAALMHAEALGWPLVLAPMVTETRAAHAELEIVASILQGELDAGTLAEQLLEAGFPAVVDKP